jgi:FkbM family methyltransferase
MLIDLDYLAIKYNLQLKGIMHIGAHLCEEIVKYDRYLPRQHVVWVEANTEKVASSKLKYPDILIETAVVSDVREKVIFHVANNGESSSFLEFGTHASYYPHIQYIQHFEAMTVPITDILCKYPDIPFNFINLDIQGAELKALKGFGEYLANVDYIYTEVNEEEVYGGGALIGEIDDYLSKWEFVRVFTSMVPQKWGDAFFVKKKLLTEFDIHNPIFIR